MLGWSFKKDYIFVAHCEKPAFRIVAIGEASGEEEVGGDEDEVGQHGGGDHVVEVPLRVLHQVGQRGAVDGRGEGELLFVLIDAGSWSCRKEVDEKGEEGEDVDQHADDDEHSLKVDVVEGGLPPLLQHPLVLAPKKNLKKRRSSHLAEEKGVMVDNPQYHPHLFILPAPS